MLLTKSIQNLLEHADLETFELNDVAMSTMYALEARELVSSDWRRGLGPVSQTTAGGSFPRYSRVKLTEVGVRAARSLQGLRCDL
ncbi:hypothetical protein [Roseateles sp. P5_D6]